MISGLSLQSYSCSDLWLCYGDFFLLKVAFLNIRREGVDDRVQFTSLLLSAKLFNRPRISSQKFISTKKVKVAYLQV